MTLLESVNKAMKMPHPFKATALLFLFLKAAIVSSGCEYKSSHSCTNRGFSSTFTVDFINYSGSSDYKASTRFLWGIDDETITKSYSSGDWQQVSRTFTHGYAGTFTVGLSLVFGEGSCENRYDEVYELTYDLESKTCYFDYFEGTHEPEPPEPATPEPATPEPATPEPATPEPVTPAPVVPVVDVSFFLRRIACQITHCERLRFYDYLVSTSTCTGVIN
jgi:hypothetical protein